jgi:predicted DNA-binding transcriptional regulator AlpA
LDDPSGNPLSRFAPSLFHVSALRASIGRMAVIPHWPGMMRRSLAARYCDLSVAEFEREIAAGRLPMPVKLGNSEHWSKARMDEALERIAGGSANDWRSKLGLPKVA